MMGRRRDHSISHRFDWQTAPSNRAKGTLMNGCSQITSNVLMQVHFFGILHQGQNYCANMIVSDIWQHRTGLYSEGPTGHQFHIGIITAAHSAKNYLQTAGMLSLRSCQM